MALKDCIVCNGFGSVDPSERVIDFSKPELGTTRKESNPLLEVCPACKGTGKEDQPSDARHKYRHN